MHNMHLLTYYDQYIATLSELNFLFVQQSQLNKSAQSLLMSTNKAAIS